MSGDGLTRARARLESSFGPRLRVDAPIAPLTTFRIGGPAALYLEPDTVGELLLVGEILRATDLPFLVLGKGSNVLVHDAGFAGLVVRLGRGFRWSARTPSGLSAGGAMPLPGLSGIALTHGLRGLEFAIAIPATVGGAVRMNAGAHGSCMADVVASAQVVDLEAGVTREIARDDLGFAYRRSALARSAIVVGVAVDLSAGDPAGIRERMDEARRWRRETQPIGEPNCGSVFKNPPEAKAARLIEEAGCKGLRIGGAAVSTKHANFIIADPGTSAADVRSLIQEVRRRVAAETGIELEPEVHEVGGAGIPG